jgi:flagellar assembly protein FliH
LSNWEPISDKKGSPADFSVLGCSGHTAYRDFESLGRESQPEDPPLEEENGGITREDQAEAVLEEARQRAVQIEREAFEKGFAQGEKAGREMAERSCETTLQALDATLSRLQDIDGGRSAQMEEEVVRLALHVARKIMQRDVQTDPQVVVDVVRAALKKCHAQEDVVVYVNPMDRDTLSEMRPALMQELRSIRHLRIEAKESIERGGALVECAIGELDVRLERQLGEVERAFEQMINQGPGSSAS